MLLFKNVSKQQREERTDFHAVPLQMNLAQAREMLDERESGQQQVRLK